VTAAVVSVATMFMLIIIKTFPKVTFKFYIYAYTSKTYFKKGFR